MMQASWCGKRNIFSGCYLFSLHVCTHDMKKVLAAIRRNGVEVATVFDQVFIAMHKKCKFNYKILLVRITLITTRTAWPARQSSWSWPRGIVSRSIYTPSVVSTTSPGTTLRNLLEFFSNPYNLFRKVHYKLRSQRRELLCH